MTMVNALNRLDDSPAALAMLREGIGIILRLLSPIAPHITHAMWRELDFGSDMHAAGWPSVDESALVSDSIAYVVQVNGSAKLKLPDGEIIYVGYDGKTDREYQGLGTMAVAVGVSDAVGVGVEVGVGATVFVGV